MRLPLLVLAVAMTANCAGTPSGSKLQPRAAESVDLQRFMGTWYVIANVPYFFENGKVATRDEYRLRPDGRIDNDFVFKKRFGEADRRWSGVATVVPGSGGARWKVQFIWPFSSELMVVKVDEDYDGAALMSPDGSLAWVFGRAPVMQPERYDALVATLKANGVDTSIMRKVPQVDDAASAPAGAR
jgi:apolipoprotein D and lipocalin family protein